MKSADFSNMFLNASTTTIALAGLLVCYSLSASADAPPPESFNKSSELVLTLSDQWIQTNTQNSFRLQNSNESNKILNQKTQKRPVKVDCGMDVNQNAGIDNSLSNRLTGECELHYSY